VGKTRARAEQSRTKQSEQQRQGRQGKAGRAGTAGRRRKAGEQEEATGNGRVTGTGRVLTSIAGKPAAAFFLVRTAKQAHDGRGQGRRRSSRWLAKGLVCVIGLAGAGRAGRSGQGRLLFGRGVGERQSVCSACSPKQKHASQRDQWRWAAGALAASYFSPVAGSCLFLALGCRAGIPSLLPITYLILPYHYSNFLLSLTLSHSHSLALSPSRLLALSLVLSPSHLPLTSLTHALPPPPTRNKPPL
jgi:hypothetical protein